MDAMTAQDVKALVKRLAHFADHWSPNGGDWGQVHLVREAIAEIDRLAAALASSQEREKAAYARGVNDGLMPTKTAAPITHVVAEPTP